MTPQQLATLKAASLADQTAAAFYTNGDLSGLADYLNEPAAPAFVVWRNEVPRDELQNLDAFNWTVVDNLATNSKFRIWEWMFENPERKFNPSKANIRAGIAACWVGNAQLVAVQTAILQACKRHASRFEKIFAVGAGSDAVPATMDLVGPISYTELIGL